MITEHFLPDHKMLEVLECSHRHVLFIGGILDHTAQQMILWTGDLATLQVPFSEFEPSGNGVEPDFTRFKVIDYGNTLQFGEYEAAADVLFDNTGARRVW